MDAVVKIMISTTCKTSNNVWKMVQPFLFDCTVYCSIKFLIMGVFVSQCYQCFSEACFKPDLSWSKMNPELFQSLALFVYSVLFFSIGLIMWRKKRKRSHALGNHFPCATYLRMRFETARLFETKEHSQSRIGALRFAIR